MKKPRKLTALAIAFGFGSVFSNRGHGELGAYIKDQRYERQDDDDHEPLRFFVPSVNGEAQLGDSPTASPREPG